jgi:hypothetical protein
MCALSSLDAECHVSKIHCHVEVNFDFDVLSNFKLNIPIGRSNSHPHGAR